ncbi:MAG: winged helix-turn-helix domain-containing protein [Acidobacteriaceae bacterium]|nr:winged helix-turn-helix domain-containing protein [Acidobacteriaceae bacterium]
MQTSQQNTRLSFGLFEADLDTGELYKAGFRIKLQSQPFKVLACLLERPGHVITREELQLRLWGKDTVVDFDHSLGTAVNKIREALGDSAENPRFIETLARRGYRFIAPVGRVEQEPQAAPSVAIPLPGSQPHVTPPTEEQTAPQPSAPAVEPPQSSSSQPEITSAASRSFPAKPERSKTSRYGKLAIGTVLLAAALAAGYTVGRNHSRLHPPHITQITHNGHLASWSPATETLASMVTDGPYLYAASQEEGRYQISAIELSGGTAVPMHLPADVASPTIGDISPDGSHLLLHDHLSTESEQPLWVVPTFGGSAQRVGNVLAHDATWMPDGQSILYANGNDLLITHFGAPTPRLFARLPGRGFWMRWEPNGHLLRLTVIDPQTHIAALYQLSATAPTPQRLLPGFSEPASECCGVWTADGSSYIFQSSRGGSANLWQLKGERTTSPQQLTDGPLDFQAPVAARSGQRVYFLGVDSRSEVQRVLPSGDLTPDRTFLASAGRVDYTRDGQWVAWTDTEGRLWRAKADGSERLQLSPDTINVFMMRWSPDGSRLALMAREPGKAWQLFTVGANGGNLQPVLQETRNAGDPSWSPDGKQILFGRLNDVFGKESGERTLRIVHLDTGQTEAVPGSEGLFSPRWSPDGRWIAALTLDQRQVRLYNTATHAWQTLQVSSGADPIWSADSKSLYFHASLDPEQPIFRASIPDGKLTEIVRLSDSRARDAVDYILSGLMPDGTPLIRTRSYTGNLYALDLEK